MHNFELFYKKLSKTIVDIYTHFMDIVNSLKVLSKSISNLELVNKILRSLPKNWDPKVTAIQESKNLNHFPIKELIGSLC